jgi:hypothetical protein
MSKTILRNVGGIKAGIQLIRETLSDGSKVYQIEITKPVTIVCLSVDEAFETFSILDRLWIEEA